MNDEECYALVDLMVEIDKEKYVANKTEAVVVNNMRLKFDSDRMPTIVFDKLYYPEDELCSILFELSLRIEDFVKTKSCAIVNDGKLVGIVRR